METPLSPPPIVNQPSTARLPSNVLPPSVNFLRVPFQETFVRVGYVDVGLTDGPVVLAVHGAPGSVQDFAELFGPLADAGIRIVVPEFPGYGNTTVEDTTAFDQSTESRANLVESFLRALDVKSVTAVVGHSMGVATAFHLVANSDQFESIVCLSSIGFTIHHTIKPYWLIRLYASIQNNSWLSPVLNRLLSYGYQLRGFNADHNSIEGMRVGLLSASRIGFDQIRLNSSIARDKKVPMLFAFAQNDRLVEWKCPHELMTHCATHDDNVSWMDADERVKKGPSVDEVETTYPRGLVFERGGHLVHRAHQSIVNRYIINLVRDVQRRKGTSV